MTRQRSVIIIRSQREDGIIAKTWKRKIFQQKITAASTTYFTCNVQDMVFLHSKLGNTAELVCVGSHDKTMHQFIVI